MASAMRKGLGFAALAVGVAATCIALYPDASSPADVPAVAYRSLPAGRAEKNADWREIRTLPEGVHRIALGAIPEDGALRLAYVPRRTAEKPAQAKVYAGGRLVSTLETASPLEWTGARIDLGAYAGADCDVVFESGAMIQIADCELVPEAAQRPNVLVILIDTLRADHLGAYGYARDTSPNIDALAAEGVRFDATMSSSSWTRPAVASLMTSAHPAAHGVNDRVDVLPPHIPTVAAAFSEAGYATQGFISNPNCLPMWGFGGDFTRYVDVASYTLNPAKDEEVADAAIAAIENLAGRPWFLYVHTIGPHGPYEPPAPYDDRFRGDAVALAETDREHAEMIAQYDGEIAFTDLQVGRIVQTLRDRGLYDDTMIVITADHGEQFWEHGRRGHGVSLYDEEIRIPFIVKMPAGEQAGTVVPDVTQILDIAPTALDVAGIPIPERFQGESLAGRIRNGAEMDRIAHSSLLLELNEAYATRSGGLKFINDIVANRIEWFDLAQDPGESSVLAAAPEAGNALIQFASRVAASGGDGLHILVTGSLNEPRTITGRIQGSRLGQPRLQYAANNGVVETHEDAVTFSITTSPGPDTPFDLIEWHESGAEQNNAQLRIAAPADEDLVLTIEIDGVPAPDSMVFLGPEKRPGVLNEAKIRPGDIAAPTPESFSPTMLPRQHAVYVWYVPGPGAVTDDELDPAMAEALRALGYI